MRKNLTDRFVRFVRPTERQTDYWDTTLTGFGLRVSPGGKKVFEPRHEPLILKNDIQAETMSDEIASQLFNVKRGANDPVDEWHTFAPNEMLQKVWAEGRQRMKKANDTFVAAGRSEQ